MLFSFDKNVVAVNFVQDNQSDAQGKHTKHCEQGLYLAETS